MNAALSFRKDRDNKMDLQRWLDEAVRAPIVEDWRKHALCKDRTNLFYDESYHRQREAIRYCKTCPVSAICARQAIELEQWSSRATVWGVQAGLTAKERVNAYRLNARRPQQWAS